ncbi:MAG TPA: alpha-L-rhamnosidase C-terminal domain-containing protein [Acidobacteriaceae bacterium]|nr:alpha-L-rhamnosidase C-terminal domain-containing protein [Acidobacteriaceae bacterium]
MANARSRRQHYFRITSIIFFLLIGMVLPGAAESARPLNTALVASSWPASWIASPTVPARAPGVFYFRRQLTLASVPEHYWVHVSADNRYILEVNGKYVAEGPARGDLFHWRFETVDLAPFFHSGNNIIAAVVWNFGDLSPVAQMSDRTGFLMQGDTQAEAAVNTGRDWQVRQEPGRSALNHEAGQGYYGAGPAEKIDGRVSDSTWDQPTTDSSGWQTPRLLGHAATREAEDASNNWELVQDLLPPMEHRLVDAGTTVRVDGLGALPAFPAAPVTIPANSHVTLLLDHRVLQTAYPDLTVSGGRDAQIKVTYAEALYDSQGNKGNRNEIADRHIEGLTDQFIASGGEQVFQPLWWRTWRYLQLDITTKSEPLQLVSLRAWFSAYPFHASATISADIPRLNQIWNTGWRTARLCAHETYMDTPYWEQLQYVGDTRIQALISYVMTGDARLARQAITNIDDSRTPEGITESRYPSALPQFIPPFSLLWVNMLHDYWMYVDDPQLVRYTVPHTRTVLDWYAARLRPDGLLGNVKWWEFGDWTATYRDGVPPQDASGGSTFLTLQFIEALQAAAEMESQYGSPERVQRYNAIIRKASAALNRENWDSRYGLYADTPSKNSWSWEANILAVMLDVAPRDQQQTILERLLASKTDQAATFHSKPVPPLSEPSYYFRFYLSRALDHAGLGNLYLSQLQPWYAMLDLGLTTWAETPEPTRSDSHAWSASPNYDLLTLVAGIRPAAPGFSKVLIEPHLQGLHHLDASMPHAGGAIHVVYKLEGNRWTAAITLPLGLNGSLVWNDQKIPLHPGTQTLTLTGRSLPHS